MHSAAISIPLYGMHREAIDNTDWYAVQRLSGALGEFEKFLYDT